MRCCLAVIFGLLVAAPALAGPGEPRLIQGTLEWPSAVAAEPFVIVRTDDGRLYYVDISSAQRRLTGPLAGGTGVALLGIEGAKPQEITALAIGAGDVAALARAITSGATSEGAVGVTPGTPMPGVSPSRQEGPSGSAPPRRPAVGPSPGKSSMGPAAPTTSAAPPPITSAPASDAIPGTEAISPGRRWTEIRGVTEMISARTLVLRTDDGHVFIVDVSELNANLADRINPGTTVSVYGDAVETKFRARGVMHSEGPAAPERRAVGDPSRKRSR